MTEDWLLDECEDQKNGKVLFKIHHKQQILAAKKRQEEYEFRGYLYPSSLYWGMCVADHVYNIRTPKFYPIKRESEEKKDRGTAFHEIIQQSLLDSGRLYDKPNYPDFIKQKLKGKKRKKKFPEVYYCSDYWFISAYADCTLSKLRKPWIYDIKTKNEDPRLWVDIVKILSGKEIDGLPFGCKNEKEKQDLILKWSNLFNKEQTQVYIYAVLSDTLEYYDKPIEGVGLAYYNNLCYLTEVDPEFEWCEPIDPAKYQRTIELLNECRNQMLRSLAGEEKVCNYCEKHKEANTTN